MISKTFVKNFDEIYKELMFLDQKKTDADYIAE